MSKYLIYDLENIQPIKISSTLSQYDKEYCESYISGNVVKGSYIGKYIKHNKVSDINSGEHKEKLLKGKNKFFNAYPVVDGRRSYPLPRCFYKVKDNEYSNEIKIGNEEKDGERYEKIKNCEFVRFNFNKEELKKVTVRKENYLHINTSKDNENTKIFRYESISSGAIFRGVIEFTGDNAEINREECKSILKKNNGEVYIGGSRSSGYGLCRIYNIKYSDQNPEILDLYKDDEEDNTEFLYLYAASNIIYRNRNGIYKSIVDPYYIKEKLELEEVTISDSFVDNEVFTGFNNKWGYRLPLINGIKAGSVMVYKYKGNLDKTKVINFINEGIGDRKGDGFGHIILFSELPFNELNELSGKDKKDIALNELNQDEKDELKLILNRIYRKKLDDKLTDNIFELKNNTNMGKINNNQVGKMFNLMCIIESLNKEEGIRKISEYFEHINSKKNNRQLSDILKNIKIKGITLQKFILDYIRNTNSDEFEKGIGLYPINVNGVSSEISDNDIYRYKVKILKEMFRLQLRKNNKEVCNNGNEEW